VHTAKEKI